MATPSPELCHRLVEVACRAPSGRNAQPWRWQIIDSETLELGADRTRQARHDEVGARELAISCGAALHHGTVGARALGLTPDVTLLPTASDPDLLARIRLTPGNPAPDGPETLDLIGQRRTDRRRFTAWPVPAERLGRLMQAGDGWGAAAVPVVEADTRRRAELLQGRARELLRAGGDPRQASSERDLEDPDGLLLLCTAEDDQRAWLAVGQTLSALWLAATRDGLSIVPLSQVIEVDETREDLRRVFGELAHPQLLVRVGWQEISSRLLTRTPRRPLADVLRS